MDCSAARRLIDSGVSPGSTNPERAALGFHLAGCPQCRAYRAMGGERGLLAALLADVAAPAAVSAAQPGDRGQPAPAAPAPVAPAAPRPAASLPAPASLAPRPAPPRVRRRRGTPVWRYAVVTVLAVIAIGLGLVVGRIARAAYTIGGNIAAMQITAAPTRLPGTPTLAVPTAESPVATAAALVPPAATTTPLPAAGVLDAPAAPPLTPDAGVATDSPLAPAGQATAPPQAAAPPSPISLPGIGVAAVPTLMPTVGVAPISGEAINILLLGSDRRPGEGWQTRSDAIMVVRLEPARQRIALLSFPRDLIVNIPGYGYSRINAATVYGEMYPELGGGSELARATVSELTGLPIHHVVRADFNAFITAVDAVGGIDLVVEKELYDPAYPTMDYGYMVAHFLPGPQHLDGQTALMYARLRHADSDYYRARRQQQVIQAIMQRVREQNVLGQVQMMADLSNALRDNMQTDLSLDEMIGMAWAFRNYGPDQVERYTLDESLTSVGAAGDPYAITASPGAVQLVVGQLLGQ